MSEAYAIRPLVPEADLTPLLALINEVEQSTGAAELTSREHLTAILARPRSARWLVVVPGQPERVVGCGILHVETRSRCFLEMIIHPRWEGCGLEVYLLAYLIERARERGAVEVGAYTGRNDEALRTLLAWAGFSFAGAMRVLEASAAASFPPPQRPPGYAIRSYADAPDEAALADAMNRCHAHMWGHWENMPGAVTQDVVKGWLAGWNPEGVFLAIAPDQTIAGLCRMELACRDSSRGAEADILDGPGVAPQHHHMQLQRPLVLSAVAWARRHGSRTVRLETWGDSLDAIALYEDLGFTIVQEELGYRLAL